MFESDTAVTQDDWFVIEGIRDAGGEGFVLGAQGDDGATTLAAANSATGANLVDKIGTPTARGSTVIPYFDAFSSWQALAAFASDIGAQHLPYISFSLPGSATPTINSSSLIASVRHYSGIDIDSYRPMGLRMSPGMTMLLGTRGDD